LIAAGVGVLLLTVVASAYALTLRAAEIVIEAEGSFGPTSLPKQRNAPITLRGGDKLSTPSPDSFCRSSRRSP
jgi:hypothetical protein